MESIHIGLVVYGDIDQISGGYRYDRKLVSHCRRQGDTVDVISIEKRSPQVVLDSLSRSVRQKLDRPVDVLLVDGLCYPSVAAHLTRLERPEMVLGLVHHVSTDDPTTPFPRLTRPIERRFLQNVDGVITTSAFLRDGVKELAPNTESLLVAHPGGRADGPAVTDEFVDDRSSEQPLRVLFVGNLVPRKDPQTLLGALARLRHEEWHATIVGDYHADPQYAMETTRLADSLGIADRVTFTGSVSDSRLETVFEESHVCCVPSQYEAFGMVFLEAMEYGVVPIAGTNGGARELVSDGVSGFLVEPGDGQEIAARIHTLADDRERLSEMGTNALTTATNHPGWDETMARLRSVLLDCAGREESSESAG